MSIDIVTKDDLQVLRVQLLDDIKQVKQTVHPKAERQWLKNAEVKKILGVSSNTIQRLRVAGRLESSKVGGAHYYRYEDVEALLDGGKKCYANS